MPSEPKCMRDVHLLQEDKRKYVKLTETQLRVSEGNFDKVEDDGRGKHQVPRSD